MATISDKVETTYSDAVIVHAVKDGYKTVHWVIPNIKRLTDSKRLSIGAEVWSALGKLEQWNSAPNSEKLRWTRTQMGRYNSVTVVRYAFDNGSGETQFLADILTDSSLSGGYPTDDIRVVLH